jgi:hypothetical protein
MTRQHLTSEESAVNSVIRPSSFQYAPPPLSAQPLIQQLFERIDVKPPYFALSNLQLLGSQLLAEATAEAPAYGEQGVMTAAELGRHAAISGLCHIALCQTDDARRYYLAKKALCSYYPVQAAYGTPVTFKTTVRDQTKRDAQVAIVATALGHRVAEFTIDYAILTEKTFGRLFKSKARPAAHDSTPYSQLLSETFERGDDWAEQVIPAIPERFCAGHFEGYPALPVAVLMGQLAYLAGQLVDTARGTFQVVKGEVEAFDLCWAGEAVSFRAQRLSSEGSRQHYHCSAQVGAREMARMQLELAVC